MATSYFKSATLRKRIAIFAAVTALIMLMSAAAHAQRQSAAIARTEGNRVGATRIIPVPNPPPVSRIDVVPNPGELHASVWVDQSSYRDGDPIAIKFKVTDDAYVYIFDTDTEGVTRQIFPNFWDQANFVHGGRTISLPSRDYSLIVSGPAGREHLEIVAVTDDSPVYRGYRSFDQNNPYPVRRGGAQHLLDEVKVEFRGRSNKSGGVSAEGTIRSSRIIPGANRIEVQPHAIEVVGPAEPLYARATTSFTVRPRYERHLFGQLNIDSDPRKAQIFIDGKYFGKTPETVTLSFGRHEILLQKRGYHEEVIMVSVDHTGRESMDVDLDKARWR